MERFGLLVGVCLLLADVAAAAPTLTVRRTPDGRSLPGLPTGNWLTTGIGSRYADSAGPVYEPCFAETGLSVQTRQAAADDAIFRRRVRWDSPASWEGDNAGPGSVSLILTHGRDGYRKSEGHGQTIDMSAWRLASEEESALGESVKPPGRAQPRGADAAERSLGEHIFGVVLSMGRLSIEKAKTQDSLLARGQKSILPTDQEGKPGLAAPVPGAVVLASLGLGLLGWLRKRAVW